MILTDGAEWGNGGNHDWVRTPRASLKWALDYIYLTVQCTAVVRKGIRANSRPWLVTNKRL